MVRRSLRSRRRGNQWIPKSAKIGATRYSKAFNTFAFRAYRLTTGSGIVEALVRAKERGVDVRLIADKTTPCERESVPRRSPCECWCSPCRGSVCRAPAGSKQAPPALRYARLVAGALLRAAVPVYYRAQAVP